MPKYHNRKVENNGIVFDSQAEAKHYGYLRLLEAAGDISGLHVHPVYTLQEAFIYRGIRVRAITYEADFAYIEDDEQVVVDVKGVETEVFKLKAKLFKRLYPDVRFEIVRVER